MKLDPIRALRIIEGLTLQRDDDDVIYMIAHQAGKPDCAKNHVDFYDKAIEIERQLIAGRVISEWSEDV